MNTKRKLSLGAFLSTLLIVLLFSFCVHSVYAYFTATTNRDFTLEFATLEIDLQNSGTSIQNDSAVITNLIEGVMPGDSISFNNITVANTGTGDSYVLVNVKIQISTTLSYDLWYNLAGTVIDIDNITSDMSASLLTKASTSTTTDTATFNASWTIPGADVTDAYQSAPISLEIKAYAVQAYLPDRPNTFASDAHYASYFICNNYTTFES